MTKEIDITEEEHAADCEHEHESKSFESSPDRIIERAASLLRAAGDPERLRLLERLGHAEACVGELADELGWGMPTISQRLKVLHQEELISRRRDGKHIYYALNDDHVRNLLANVLDHVKERR
jgi:DNA-binding transcriptional ArsR family regulator